MFTSKDFELYCSDFRISDGTQSKAWDVLTQIAPIAQHCSSPIDNSTLFASALFISVQDAHFPLLSKSETISNPEVTVSQLLEKSAINIMDFILVLSFVKASLSDSTKQCLIALEIKYLIVSALFNKFESMVTEIFHWDTTDEQHFKDRRALSWLLFLVAKAKILWNRQELLATFNLLVCCVGEVIKQTPSYLLLPPFSNSVANNEDFLDILELLSSHFGTKYEEVKAVYDGYLHVSNELKNDGKFPKLEDLHCMYNSMYLKNGDIDESRFLDKDWHLLPSSDQSSSPEKVAPPSVRRTLNTAEALFTILLSVPDDLAPSAMPCLTKCPLDVASIIKEFLSDFREIFKREYLRVHEDTNESLAERRFQLASRYYILMLDTLLKRESERLSEQKFTIFIQNRTFHKTLLACCIEVTLMSCGTVGSVSFTPVPQKDYDQVQGTTFPWILNAFQLQAFDFFRIIESFVIDAPTITMQIINHLSEIKNKILESLAWKSGSSIFSNLPGRECPPSCRMKLDIPSTSSKSHSPNKNASEQSPSTPHTCHAISLFLNKVCRLCSQRLEKLCAILKIEEETRICIWTCIEHVLYQKTHLLRDRHLDQIMMCCMYGVCRSMDKNIKFRSIVDCYDSLPCSTATVYKQVLSAGKKGFIFSFYNKEFYNEMKEYILQNFGTNYKGAISSPLRASPSPMQSPLYSLPNRKNIFVSPLLKSPFKNPNEVLYRKLPSYVVGSISQSSKALQDMNLAILKSSPKASESVRGKKKLQFDSEDNVLNDPIKAKKFLRFDLPDNQSA